MADTLKNTAQNAPSVDPAKENLDRVTQGAGNTLAKQDTSNMSDEQRKIHEQQMRAQGQIEGEKKDKDSSLKISISLDLDVEVHLTARVKGDIVIGLL